MISWTPASLEPVVFHFYVPDHPAQVSLEAVPTLSMQCSDRPPTHPAPNSSFFLRVLQRIPQPSHLRQRPHSRHTLRIDQRQRQRPIIPRISRLRQIIPQNPAVTLRHLFPHQPIHLPLPAFPPFSTQNMHIPESSPARASRFPPYTQNPRASPQPSSTPPLRAPADDGPLPSPPPRCLFLVESV